MANLAIISAHAITPAASALQALQAFFVISRIGGEVKLIDRQEISDVCAGVPNATIHFMSKRDGDLVMKRYIETLPIPVSKPADVVNDFWMHPHTHVYKRMTFNPTPQPHDVLNLWAPHTTELTQGSWKAIEDFLLNVICSGDNILFEYVVNYLAHALQCPGSKPGVMIVLIGNEGVGKGFFIRLLEAIWGRTTLQVSDIGAITGNYNKALETALWVALDEALFKGDKRSQDRMKSLVTEPTIQVEQKYEPSRTIESFHRFVACTNHAQWGQIRSDDRRCLFIKVSDCHKQDANYFGALSTALNDGVNVPALAYELLNRNIASYNPRVRPQTQEGFEQKRRSLSGFARYWFEVLGRGDFVTGHPFMRRSIEYENARFISNKSLLEQYRTYDRTSEKYESLQTATIRQDINALCPSANTKLRPDNRRGVTLPHIDVARKEFEAWIGCAVPWGE